jgi:hypothetical protein
VWAVIAAAVAAAVIGVSPRPALAGPSPAANESWKPCIAALPTSLPIAANHRSSAAERASTANPASDDEVSRPRRPDHEAVKGRRATTTAGTAAPALVFAAGARLLGSLLSTAPRTALLGTAPQLQLHACLALWHCWHAAATKFSRPSHSHNSALPSLPAMPPPPPP